MKRQASGADGGGASKRPAPADDGAVGDLGLLRRQNKMLGQELVRYKRHIGESREELEMIRGKSRDMEALVSAVQRAWSQVSLLLAWLSNHTHTHTICLILSCQHFSPCSRLASPCLASPFHPSP